MEFKICGTCKQTIELSIENFSLSKRSKDGFSIICKPCKREYDREYRKKNKERIAKKQKNIYQKNKERISEYQKGWRERNKEHLKRYKEANKEAISEFNKRYWIENKEKRKQAISVWRKENAEYIKEYRRANRERDRKQSRKWYSTENGKKFSITRTNRRRAKIKNLKNDFTNKQWNECLEHFDYSCAYCGEHHEVLEQEHFVAISNDGHFTKDNIVPACRSCNASKHNKDVFEWYPKQENFVLERLEKILKYLGREMQIDTLQIHR